MLRSFVNPIARKAILTASASTRRYNSNIVRLGVDVLPTMSQAVVHNGVVYLSGQVDGTAEHVIGECFTLALFLFGNSSLMFLHRSNLKRT